jgi:hypothetical protein
MATTDDFPVAIPPVNPTILIVQDYLPKYKNYMTLRMVLPESLALCVIRLHKKQYEDCAIGLSTRSENPSGVELKTISRSSCAATGQKDIALMGSLPIMDSKVHIVGCPKNIGEYVENIAIEHRIGIVLPTGLSKPEVLGTWATGSSHAVPERTTP